jgi:hypothetical protein
MSVETEQEIFVANSKAYWDAINSGDSEKATEVERSTKAMVDKWVTQNIVVDVLTSMLSDYIAEVRFFAAAYLVNLGDSNREKAIKVLEEISRQETGLMPVSAAAILRVRCARPN